MRTETMKDSSMMKNSNHANSLKSTNDVYHKLKYTHLPDLKSLYDDCIWLTSKLELGGKRELQSSETRLIQFVSVVSSTIKQIENLKESNDSIEWEKIVLAIESKIIKTILPVRARIMSKLGTDKTSSSLASSLLSSNNVHHQTVFEHGKKDSVSQKSTSPAVPVIVEPSSPIDHIKRIRSADDSTDAESLTASESSSTSPITSSSSSSVSTSSSLTNSSLASSSSSSNKPLSYPSYQQSTSNFLRNVATSSASFDNKHHVNQHHVNHHANQQISQHHHANQLSNQPSQAANQHHHHHEVVPQIPINTSSTIYYSSATDPTINGLSTLSSSCSTSCNDDNEFVTSRRRKRLNQIVPNPRKPRHADYNCSVCNEAYSCIVQDNPWWAVYHHECPKCHLTQVPRIDISLNSNAVENDPNVVALYGEGLDDDDDDDQDDDDDDEEDDDDATNSHHDDHHVNSSSSNQDNDDLHDDDVDDEKPFDGEGLLAQEEASKLLVLMCHARTCSGYHASPKHAEICRSTKFLMLHIRDCTGRDVHARECKFPWCLPCKKMLRHLTRCYDPANCAVCNPWSLPESYQQLRALNQMSSMPVA